jgi:DNA-binding transcriptional MerR regulator
MEAINGPAAPGAYSTQAVSTLTGIPVTTILAWERRYGLPRPRRAEGGRRLYSAEDVDVLRAMRARTAQGVRAQTVARSMHGSERPAAELGPALPRVLPTQVQEISCLHCGEITGELQTQRGPRGVVSRFELAAGASRPVRGPGGRPRCGRCGGDLYREPGERRALAPFRSRDADVPARRSA